MKNRNLKVIFAATILLASVNSFAGVLTSGDEGKRDVFMILPADAEKSFNIVGCDVSKFSADDMKEANASKDQLDLIKKFPAVCQQLNSTSITIDDLRKQHNKLLQDKVENPSRSVNNEFIAQLRISDFRVWEAAAKKVGLSDAATLPGIGTSIVSNLLRAMGKTAANKQGSKDELAIEKCLGSLRSGNDLAVFFGSSAAETERAKVFFQTEDSVNNLNNFMRNIDCTSEPECKKMESADATARALLALNPKEVTLSSCSAALDSLSAGMAFFHKQVQVYNRQAKSPDRRMESEVEDVSFILEQGKTAK